ncbi:hypothetical protein OA78_0970 [Latilactobacillus curvatus]|nr:hypothetical protein [Latilactobacillus curvatus]EHE85795.1 hypothetical protein CRL705_1092 [Latilactobacillus curvatus CRL 705]KHO13025.1 hypothetical protein OA78_0970 [Latilactobacillus curvatus]
MTRGYPAIFQFIKVCHFNSNAFSLINQSITGYLKEKAKGNTLH